MKIAIGSFVLVPGGRDSDEEAETTAVQAAQVVQNALRAVNGRVFQRGNRVFTFTFSKTTEHESFQAAERFRLLHPTDFPAEGFLTFTTEGAGGGEASIYYAEHNVDSVRIRQIGATTITTYTITAAGPSTSAPTA